MKVRTILVCLAVIIVLNSAFVEATGVSKSKEPLEKENDYNKLVPLKKEDLKRLNEFVNSIEDPKLKGKVRDVLNLIITDDGDLDTEAAEGLALGYYNEIKSRTATEKFPDLFCKTCSNKFLPKMESAGTSTIFTAPYSGCFSWGDKTWGVDEYAHGCNCESGSVGAYANAFVGGATAEGMQQLNFYVGRTKAIGISAELVRTGGKTTFGFAGFAGTEKTWSWDDFEGNYHRSDVDPWWNWDDIVLKIIGLVTVIVGFVPGTISQAISLLSTIVDFNLLNSQMQDMLDEGDAEVLNVEFNFSASPGWHTIWVGLRATASACITGTGSAVTMAQVSKIIVNGIAAPTAPDVYGPDSGKPGLYTFSFVSTDPNQDNIQYKVEWGDDSVSDYSNFYESGDVARSTHYYEKEGTYTIKVRSKDIDRLESHDYGIYTIVIKKSVAFPVLANILRQCRIFGLRMFCL